MRGALQLTEKNIDVELSNAQPTIAASTDGKKRMGIKLR